MFCSKKSDYLLIDNSLTTTFAKHFAIFDILMVKHFAIFDKMG